MKTGKSCAIGCGTLLIVVVGIPFLISGPQQRKKNQEAFKRIQAVKFAPGESTLNSLIDESFLSELEIIEKKQFPGATYIEWDHGYLQGWFLGNPVDDLVIHYHFGTTRVNQNMFLSTWTEHATHPDQIELARLLTRIEDYYKENRSELGGGSAQHILYSLQRLRKGDKRYGLP